LERLKGIGGKVKRTYGKSAENRLSDKSLNEIHKQVKRSVEELCGRNFIMEIDALAVGRDCATLKQKQNIKILRFMERLKRR